MVSMVRMLLIVVLIACLNVSPAATAPSAESAEQPPTAATLLERISNAFPREKGYIPRDQFFSAPDVKALMQLAGKDIDALLAEGKFSESFVVLNVIPWEQYARHSSTLAKPGAAPSSRDKYEKYLKDVAQHEQRRCDLEHKRNMIRMIVERLALSRPQLVVDLLNHKDAGIREFAMGLVWHNWELKDIKIVAALLRYVPEKGAPWKYSAAPTHEQGKEQDLAILAARVLSAWQVEEALDAIERLAKHPFYHCRADSIVMVNRYGFRRAIPHSIGLLTDRAAQVRNTALVNLYRLTGVHFGKGIRSWLDAQVSQDEVARVQNQWKGWWEQHKGTTDDATFHRAVVGRALALMDERGAWGHGSDLPMGPYHLLAAHLDLSSISHRDKTDQQLAAEIKRLWQENQGKLQFDVRQQVFVLRDNGVDTQIKQRRDDCSGEDAAAVLKKTEPLKATVEMSKGGVFELGEDVCCILTVKNGHSQALSIPDIFLVEGKAIRTGVIRGLQQGILQISLERNGDPLQGLKPQEQPLRDRPKERPLPESPLQPGEQKEVRLDLSSGYSPSLFSVDRAGRYKIMAVLDTTKSPNPRVWKGRVATAWVSFSVAETPAFREKEPGETDSEYAAARTDFYLARIVADKGKYSRNVIEILKTKEGVPALISVLDSDDRKKRERAQEILQRIHSPPATRTGQKLLPQSKNAWIQWWKQSGSRMSLEKLWRNFDSHWQ